MQRTTFTVFLGCLLLSALCGCTAVQEAFPGHDPDQVWTALKAAAASPDYSGAAPAERWSVRENRVWVDEEAARIEVYRELERRVHQPGGTVAPRHEQRAWKFRVQMIERDPPTVEFTSRQAGVPAHAWDEAARYFDEVREILGEPNLEPPPSVTVPPDNGSDSATSE